MKYGMQEIDWAYIGAQFANSTDEEQVLFFQAMLKEMTTWPTAHAGEMQLIAINHLLTDEEKDKLSALGFKDD